MRWFCRGTKKEVWDIDLEQPMGDIEAARKIREICDAAAAAAKKITEGNKMEIGRFGSAAKTAMEVAIRISDDGLRDSALRDIVNLCVKASDLKTALILARSIRTVSIQEDVLKDNPLIRAMLEASTAPSIGPPS
jgi:hypothetical protein